MTEVTLKSLIKKQASVILPWLRILIEKIFNTADVIEEAWYQIEENHLLKKSKKKHVLHAGIHVERIITRMIDVLGAIADIIFMVKDEPGTNAWKNKKQPWDRTM